MLKDCAVLLQRQVNGMETSLDTMTPTDMLEKLAEQNYSQNQLRDLNAKMRHWLDVADDELVTLRSENTHLRKQVNALEKIISEAQQTEPEPSKPVLTDDLDVIASSQQRIKSLEKECTLMREHNEKLSTELRALQQERDVDKISLSKFKNELQALECAIEEAESGLQLKDEVIQQKDQLLRHAEETEEEFLSTIKDLRLAKQELRQQLEERENEASLAVLTEVTEGDGAPSSPLNFAEEIKLLTSSGKMEINVFDSFDHRHEDSDTEEQLGPQNQTADVQTQRCVGVLQTAVQRVGLFVPLIFVLIILAFMALGSCVEHYDFLAFLMLQPYCCVHYDSLPPI
ncbi:uncharacterized protein LOC142901835 isoform X2 [Nelusetta ayraudi]|uniref:uncharacterized protein LOC142901835 isoform X2 n=1 Tax=Nelusetta ayraudi TaxID=303726 RepID=UPI003F6F7264